MLRKTFQQQRSRLTGLLITTGLLLCAGLGQAERILPAGDTRSLPAVNLEGHFIQGGLLIGRAPGAKQVVYRDEVLPTSGDGQFIIGLDRDADSQITLFVVDSQGQRTQQLIAIDSRSYAIQHINGVAQKYVAPDPKQLARTQRENAQVRKARSISRQQDDFLAGFIWPASGPITGVFGSQRVYNGEPRRPHYGVDVAAPVGTPVVAPAAGRIVLAEPDLFFSGGTIILDHGMGLSSTFLHLSALHVAVGDEIKQGQIIADIGATGRVTGAHLDWRMNWTHAGKSVRIDPQLLVPPLTQSDEEFVQR